MYTTTKLITLVALGLTTDLPTFPGFFEYSSLIAGSSIMSAELLSEDYNDVVVNWMGGLHHAKKSSASGFCYVNDCVLGIMRLLLKYRRVLYIGKSHFLESYKTLIDQDQTNI